MRYILALFLLLLICPPAQAGQLKAYTDGDTVLQGYFAPSTCPQTALTPTVLIAHQWMGLTDYEKKRADMLAQRCYNAFAVDIYGKDVHPKNEGEAGRLSSIYKKDATLARSRMKAALDFVRTLEGVDPDQIAVFGYCFGATMALELARSGANIKAVVSFHGGLSSPAPVREPGVIKAAIAVMHGAIDPHVPQTEVLTFMNEMEAAKADWTLTQYGGAMHAFTQDFVAPDPAKGVGYNKEADEKSWRAAMDFLEVNLHPDKAYYPETRNQL
ncbi:MAG: dienelactone hydrolase family protein [Pseudobdellovibrionaceae bacterium]